MTFWIVAAVVYLAFGFYFKKPEHWSPVKKILSHIFWLPIVIFVIIVIAAGGVRII